MAMQRGDTQTRIGPASTEEAAVGAGTSQEKGTASRGGTADAGGAEPKGSAAGKRAGAYSKKGGGSIVQRQKDDGNDGRDSRLRAEHDEL